jgi:hypothetical protein
MTERYVERFIGVHAADAEQVELHLRSGRLLLKYVDWREQAQEQVFHEVLAFKWQEQDSASVPRDDTTYEVLGSKLLSDHVAIGATSITYAHYKLCFNACGTLDIVCQAVAPPSKAP